MTYDHKPALQAIKHWMGSSDRQGASFIWPIRSEEGTAVLLLSLGEAMRQSDGQLEALIVSGIESAHRRVIAEAQRDQLPVVSEHQEFIKDGACL